MQFAGDWFNAQIGEQLEREVSDVAAFRAQLHQQIEAHFRKHDQRGMQLREVSINVTEEKFDAIRSFAAAGFLNPEAATRDGLQPAFLTFHGTSSPDAINSIVEHGFLLPGEQHPRKGYSLNMRVGNLYGDGVYSSSEVSVAMSYALQTDWKGAATNCDLIVSVLMPGKVAMAYHEEAMTRAAPPPPARPGTVNLSTVTGAVRACPWTRRWTFAADANTLTPDYRRMWIAACTEQIVPVAVVSIVIQGYSAQHYLHESLRYAKTVETLSPLPGSEAHADAAVAGGVPIRMTHLFDDYYGLPTSIYGSVQRATQIRRYYVIPRGLLYDRSFETALVHHVNGATALSCGNDLVVVYGDRPETVSASQFVKNYRQYLRRDKTHDVENAMEATFNEVCKYSEKVTRGWKDMEKDVYHVVMLFLDDPAATRFDMDSFSRVTAAFGGPLTQRYVNIKFAFSKTFGTVTQKRDDVLLLKRFQNEGIFETLYFDASEARAAMGWSHGSTSDAGAEWAPILAVANEETQNIGSWGDFGVQYIGDFQQAKMGVMLNVGTYAAAGEGFVVAIDARPVHNGQFTGPVLYTGTPPPYMYVDGEHRRVEIVRFLTNKSRFADMVSEATPEDRRRIYWKQRAAGIRSGTALAAGVSPYRWTEEQADDTERLRARRVRGPWR
jgi:hypothetical protein